MKLYRFVHKNELNNLYFGNIEGFGCNPKNLDTNANNHKYDPTKKYIHLFYNKNACQHIMQLYANQLVIHENGEIDDYYIVTFNVPLKKAIANTSIGYYNSLTKESKGYIDYQIIKKRFEVALQADDFESKWIEKIEPAVYKYINEQTYEI